jgi:hypothetical protein
MQDIELASRVERLNEQRIIMLQRFESLCSSIAGFVAAAPLPGPCENKIHDEMQKLI